MNLEFKRLTEIDKSEIIELMNNPLVRRHMPLTSDDFDDRDCNDFIAAKEKLWTDYGYGPWAFIVDGHFVGWGGLQPENGEADLGLVLHPKSWGIGKVLCDEILERAFGEMRFESVTVLLPPTRKLIKGLLQLGFKADGELEVGGERFNRYRLEKQVRKALQEVDR
jgi:RimJ/RimL family protein N-acetyltransferase